MELLTDDGVQPASTGTPWEARRDTGTHGAYADYVAWEEWLRDEEERYYPGTRGDLLVALDDATEATKLYVLMSRWFERPDAEGGPP